MGPIYDLLQITHGPVGCGFYAWLSRRNLVRPAKGQTNYLQYCMNTDMQEDQIIFGGEKKLKQAIREAYEIFKPKAIAILATCPVGLIGDDIHTVAKQMKEELGINVMAFSCEGYKGVSQSAGHHIANNGVFKNIIGLDDKPDEAEFNMNILGEYNIGGDAWEIDTLLRKCGIHRHLDVERRRQLRPGEKGAHRHAQRRDVPPLDQLHRGNDGEEIRHSVDQGEFHRRGSDGENTAQDREIF